MRKKDRLKQLHRVLVPFVFLAILAGGGIWQMLKADRSYSPSERRLLAQKPEWNAAHILDASFMSEYEAYLTDQFPFRDQWITLKTYCGLLLGQRESGGVYLAADGSLIELHREEDLDTGRMSENTEALVQFVSDMARQYGGDHVRVMLVPTAESVWKEKMPQSIRVFDQSAYLQRVSAALAEVDPAYAELLVPVGEVLGEHAQEEIYYRTDHHWTALGAYYGYSAYAESLMHSADGTDFGTENGQTENGQTESVLGAPRSLSDYELWTVTRTFCGTTAAKCGMFRIRDHIELIAPVQEETYRVDHNMGDSVTDTLYDLSQAKGDDPYAVYLGGNDAVVTIWTQSGLAGDDREPEEDALSASSAEAIAPDALGYDPPRSLLIIRDSYASCMVPYLTSDYAKITLVDLRYYNGSVRQLIEQEGYTDILVLYNIPNFVTDRSVYKLGK